MNASSDPTATRRSGWLPRLGGRLWQAAKSRRRAWQHVTVGLGLLGVIIGLGAAWTWVRSTPPRKDSSAALRRLLERLDAADYETARRQARQLRAADLTFAELGTPVFVLGAVWAHDAQQQSDPAQRRTLSLIASRYLEEARDRSFPDGREAQGTLLLAETLFASGRFADSIPELERALPLFPNRRSQLLGALAEAHFRLAPPAFDQAASYGEQYLNDKNLSPMQRMEGLYLLAKIARAQENGARCEARIAELLAAGRALQPAAGDGQRRRTRLTRDERRRLAQLLGEATALAAERQIAAADRLVASDEADAASIAAQKQALLTATRDALLAAHADKLTSAASEMLLGRVLRRLGDQQAALAQLQRAEERYFSTPEGLAAGVEEAELLTELGKSSEALEVYQRVLDSMPSRDRWQNPWISAAQLEASVLAFHAAALRDERFPEAVKLTESLAELLSRDEALLLRGDALERWAQARTREADAARPSAARELRSEAIHHFRAAGDVFEQLAALRFATPFHLTDLWRSAENYLHGNDYNNAERMIMRYLQQEPRKLRARAFTLLGEARLAGGDSEQAIAALEQCLAAYPRDPDAYRARVIAARALSESGRLAEAKALLLHNLELDALTPRSTDWRDALFDLGELLHREGLAATFQARQLGLTSPDAQRRRDALRLLETAGKRFTEAAARLSEAAQRYPTDPRAAYARYLLADAYRHLARVPHARLPTESIASRRAELVRQMRGYLELAYEQYDRLANELAERRDRAELPPVEARIARNCYLVRGHMLFELEHYPEAIAAYSDATNRYPNDPSALEAYQQIAACYRRMNDPAKARSALEQARVVLGTLPVDVDYQSTTRFSREDWVTLLQ